MGFWLHVISSVQTAILITGYGLWTQGYGVWKLKHALDWRTLAPFVIGGTVAQGWPLLRSHPGQLADAALRDVCADDAFPRKGLTASARREPFACRPNEAKAHGCLDGRMDR